MVRQVHNLKAEVGALRTYLADAIKAMKENSGGGRGGGGGGGGGNNTDKNKTGGRPSNISTTDATLQLYGKDADKLSWKTGLKMNDSWNGRQKVNYNRLIRHHDPDKHKRQQIEFYKKRLEELG